MFMSPVRLVALNWAYIKPAHPHEDNLTHISPLLTQVPSASIPRAWIQHREAYLG
jgi:hypothetical protein